MRILGLDDGYAQTKVATGEKWRLAPTCIQSGRALVSALPGGSAPTGYVAQGEGSEWTVGADLPRPSEISHDGYPASVEARVMATHAMRGALSETANGSGPVEVSVCSGVPLDRTLGGHEALVAAKRDNLLANDVAVLNGSGEPQAVGFRVVRHEVVPEAIGAWIAAIAEVGDGGDVRIPQQAMRAHLAVVDIGGRTTDVAVVWNGAVDAQASRTVEVGVAQMRAQLGDAIHRRFGARIEARQADEALRSGQVTLFGKAVDAARERDQALGAVLGQLRNEVRAALGDGAALERVLFVGGGAKLAEGAVRQWFRHGQVAPSPVLANAVGFQLYGRMAFADG